MREAMPRRRTELDAHAGEARLADFLTEWLETVRPRLRATTFVSYELSVGRITKHLGQMRLRDLTPLGIERFYADAGGRGRHEGRATVAQDCEEPHIVLRKALADAERLISSTATRPLVPRRRRTLAATRPGAEPR